MIRPILKRDFVFPGADPSAHRSAGFMHAVAASGFQMMPFGQVLALMHEAIGAAWRQPAERSDKVRRQLEAIGHARRAVGIIVAGTAVAIEKPAGDIGRQDPTIILILKLDEAATAAAIAQTFPLGIVELGERFLAPERRGGLIGHGVLAGEVLHFRLSCRASPVRPGGGREAF